MFFSSLLFPGTYLEYGKPGHVSWVPLEGGHQLYAHSIHFLNEEVTAVCELSQQPLGQFSSHFGLSIDGIVPAFTVYQSGVFLILCQHLDIISHHTLLHSVWRPEASGVHGWFLSNVYCKQLVMFAF